MGLVSGYEHHYRFSEALISSSNEAISDLGIQRKVLIFEIRTKFILQRKLDDAYGYEMMHSEALSVTLPVDQSSDSLECIYRHFDHISYRLDEYLMTDDQIQSFIHKALDYAQQITAVHPSRPIVPIVVDLYVCTVQLDGETIDHTIDRSVRPDCLIPLHLLRPDGAAKDDDDDSCLRLRDYLLCVLPRIRADDLHVEGFGALMETCPICLGGPTAAAPVSLLPCRHAFHSHCVVRWLMERESCPMCRHDEIILLEKGRRAKELDTSQINRIQDRLITRAQSTNRLPRPARVRRAPAWHDDYVMGSTNHLPVPTRVRRAPAWHGDYVMG
ncbi:E3 ubiquitin-protein ligase rlim [Phtheirospermum japonicum]|uniref:E3 ubiquitin-protein ligase rlim n=1 Tax=Phtheirospermum japonicum TaxID=374723 RepID=A0A830BFX9_9LAMI|nr:E3 ubiquitin-protein ligase rlim [Phtheirospermum japonicum]